MAFGSSGKNGSGIARLQGFVVFVKNEKTGQKVELKIDLLGKSPLQQQLYLRSRSPKLTI